MNIADFFQPVSHSPGLFSDKPHPLSLLNVVGIHTHPDRFPDLENKDIAIFGVLEDRNAPANKGCAAAPDQVRQHLYRLFQGPFKAKIADLGNIHAGEKVTDTYVAVKSVIAELLENQITPVVIGGGQDITCAVYQAYESLGQIINMVSVDPEFDLGQEKGETIHHKNYLGHILTHQPNYLFHYANIGYQTYFVDQDAIALMEQLFFDVYRLGVLRQHLEGVEPIVRNADMLSFDLSAIRQSDAPGIAPGSPNGLFGEEACQIARYAGLSDKISCVGFYEMNPSVDQRGQTAHLTAQMIWYFIDGYYHRTKDLPDKQTKDSRSFIKYVVSIKDFQNKIIFYKSKISDRWWMEVPCPERLKQKYDRHFLVACSYKDYQEACQNEIPEKWWQVYQKFV